MTEQPIASPQPAPASRGRALLFLVSQCITLFGSTLVQMAIVWYVTLATSSGAWVAAFTVCAYLPQFLISVPGGVLADRYDRKRLIIFSDAAIAVVTLALVLLPPSITEKPVLLPVILAVTVLRSLGAGVQTPAVNAVLPGLVPEAQLMRYNGINAAMQSVVQFAAPAAAGLLLTVSSLGAALLVDTATAAVGIGLLAAVAVPAVARGERAAGSVKEDLAAGVRCAFSDPFRGRLLVCYGLFIFLCVPAGFLAQLLVSRVFGDTYWYLTAVELAGFAGMTAGGLAMGAWGGFRNRVHTLLAGIVLFGLLAAAMGLAGSFPLYLVLMLFYGVALTVVQTAVTTLLQEHTPPQLQGRVFGLLGSMYSGFLPLGMAVFGPLADRIPLQAIMIGSGAALLLMAALLFADRRFRPGENKQ